MRGRALSPSLPQRSRRVKAERSSALRVKSDSVGKKNDECTEPRRS